MEEATIRRKRKRRLLRSQRGQAIVEYILVLVLALGFTRFVFFNKDFGFQALLEKTMLRIGAYLEQNLKTGTSNASEAAGTGVKSLEPYAGINRWTN